jgi:hypothetical protein
MYAGSLGGSSDSLLSLQGEDPDSSQLVKQARDFEVVQLRRNAYYCTGLPAKLNPGRGLNHRSAIGSKQQEDHVFELIGPCTSQIYLG